MLATTAERVSSNTPEEINERIAEQTEASISRHAHADRWAIERRLAQLDAEWDVERCLETMAPTVTLLGLLLSVRVHRRWLILPALVQTFFLQHALQGWCPPLPLLRQLGIRTADEINKERYALKALRGDFENVSAHDVMEAVEK